MYKQDLRSVFLSPRQSEVTLLPPIALNIVGSKMLHIASVCTPCCMTVVACCWELLRKVETTGQTFSPVQKGRNIVRSCCVRYQVQL